MDNENTKVGRKAKNDLYNAAFAVRLRKLFEENTTDYLLGRTDSKSASPDLRLAVDYTNLSQRAVQFLHTHVLNRDNLIDFFHLLMGEFIHE